MGGGEDGEVKEGGLDGVMKMVGGNREEVLLGSYIGLCFPMRVIAIEVAMRPRERLSVPTLM